MSSRGTGQPCSISATRNWDLRSGLGTGPDERVFEVQEQYESSGVLFIILVWRVPAPLALLHHSTTHLLCPSLAQSPSTGSTLHS